MLMKMIFWFVVTLGVTYLALCLLVYWQQERLLFFPTKLPASFRYSFAQPFTLYGQSMGSGFAAKLAAQHRPARLILQSPYFSMRDMAALHFFWLPRFILKYQLRTDLWLNEIDCPVYLIHGTVDPVIPYNASERLYPLIRGEKAL